MFSTFETFFSKFTEGTSTLSSHVPGFFTSGHEHVTTFTEHVHWSFVHWAIFWSFFTIFWSFWSFTFLFSSEIKGFLVKGFKVFFREFFKGSHVFFREFFKGGHVFIIKFKVIILDEEFLFLWFFIITF